MSKKKASKPLSIEQLKEEINNFKKQLMVIRFKQVSGELTNTSESKKIRRSIAKNLTLINQMKREA